MKFIEMLPVSVEIDGEEYPINSDFRASIEFEVMVRNEENEEKILSNILKIYYGTKIPPNISKAIERAIWFYSGGDNSISRNGNGKKEEALFSYEFDWDFIYAAFLEQFGIDLQEANLHWWKFKALFVSLSDKTKFCEVIGYRSVKISGKMPKEQRDFYKKMKKIYALPRSKHEEEQMQNIRERLKNGESIESVFGNLGDDEH